MAAAQMQLRFSWRFPDTAVLANSFLSHAVIAAAGDSECLVDVDSDHILLSLDSIVSKSRVGPYLNDLRSSNPGLRLLYNAEAHQVELYFMSIKQSVIGAEFVTQLRTWNRGLQPRGCAFGADAILDIGWFTFAQPDSGWMSSATWTAALAAGANPERVPFTAVLDLVLEVRGSPNTSLPAHLNNIVNGWLAFGTEVVFFVDKPNNKTYRYASVALQPLGALPAGADFISASPNGAFTKVEWDWTTHGRNVTPAGVNLIVPGLGQSATFQFDHAEILG